MIDIFFHNTHVYGGDFAPTLTLGIIDTLCLKSFKKLREPCMFMIIHALCLKVFSRVTIPGV